MGFCLVKDDDTIVSTSFAAYIDNNRIDIGIETNPEYRGQGFGALTCAAMIQYCLDNGYEPIWGCRKDNMASFRLAQKLGFKETIFHPTFWAVDR
jgi:RimJ/RimL family protein N-acetyltransferase